MNQDQKENVRPHHRTSPSTLNAREACPCYDPEQRTSEKSEAGETQHTAVQKRCLDGLTDEQALAVQKCIDFTEGIIKRAGPNPTILAEEYLPIDDDNLTAGYLDCAVIAADLKKAYVIDYKFGEWMATEAENNLQGIAYALALWHRWPQLEEISVSFPYPYLDWIEQASFKRAQKDELYLRVKTVIARYNAPDKAPNPTTGTCLFCANCGTCKAMHKAVIKIGHKFSPLDVPAIVDPQMINTAEDAGKLKRLAQVIETWAKSVSRILNTRAQNEGLVPLGYKLIPSADRVVRDLPGFRDVAMAYGVPETVLNEASSIAIGKVEKHISERAPKGGKTAAVKQFGAELEARGCVVKDTPTFSLRMMRSNEGEE